MNKALIMAISASTAVLSQAASVRELADKLQHTRTGEGEKHVVELMRHGDKTIPELVSMLKAKNDPDTVKASFALEAMTMYLSRPGADADRRWLASQLAKQLEKGCADDVSRAVVVKALQLCGGEPEVRVLAKQLSIPRVRDYAIMALTQINTPSSRDALLETAKASAPEVAMEYVSAFAKLQEPGAADLLMSLWGKVSAYERVAVMNALGEIGYGPAGKGMLNALKAETVTERGGAKNGLAKLLRNMKDREAAKALANEYVTAYPGTASIAALLDCQGVNASLDKMIQILLEGNLEARSSVARLLEDQKSDGLDGRLLEAAAKARPEALTTLIELMGLRGVPATRDFILAQTKHADAQVRKAAYLALPNFGAEAAVPVLVSMLKNCAKEDISPLKATLAWQQTDNFNSAVAGGIGEARGANKMALMELLSARGAKADSQVVFAALKDGDKLVRRSALKALNTLAVPNDVSVLLDYLANSKQAAERRLAQSVLVTLGRSDATALQAMCSTLPTLASGPRITLIQTLSRIGGAVALQAVMSESRQADAKLRDAAVRGLSSWPDFGAYDSLVSIASQRENPVHRVLALRGLIRICTLPTGKSPAERLSNLTKAQALCQSVDERRQILGAAGAIPTEETLKQLIIPAFQVPELVQEASATALRIICPKNKNDRGMLNGTSLTALNLILSKCGNESMVDKARTFMRSFPPQGIDIAFGKPVKTSCPQQWGNAPQRAVDGVIALNSCWFGNQWPSWLSVDLGEVSTIDSIRPIFYWDGRRYYTYTLDVSLDGVNWTKVVDNSKNTEVATSQGVNHVLTPAVKGRYVRLNILKNSVNEAVHLAELEVYSLSGRQPKATGPNLLLRQPVTSASHHEGNHTPDHVNDGRIGKLDGWHTDRCPTWIKVDMQQVAAIDTARVIFYWDGRRTYSYNIEVSEDDKTWIKVADNSHNQIPVTAAGIVHHFPATKARYVRLNVTRGVGGRYVHVVELEAYAAGKAPGSFPAAEQIVKAPDPLPAPDADGFITLFNGKDFTGWKGSVHGYGIKEGGIMYCIPRKGGKIMTQHLFSDFELHFDFLQAEAANNGLGIRMPELGDAAYVGMELQIIDNDGYKRRGGRLAPWQHHGSIYGVVPAKDGALKKAGEWNHQVVIARGSKIKVILNDQVIVDADVDKVEKTADGKGRAKHPGLSRRTGHIGWLGHGDRVEFKNIRIKVLEPYTEGPQNVAPEGYVPLFNGKDLTGWKGLVGNPKTRAKMTPQQLAEAQARADVVMRSHWTVKDGVLVFDGKGSALCTVKDYKDFEMLVDWKITSRGDSGIYLRGAPQVQIWDPVRWKIGSGGLYNNRKNPSRPSMIMDNPAGQWNRFKIRMVGERVSVWLNGGLIVNNVIMENYWDRKIPIYPEGQIELQNHSSPLWFRNIFIKELN